MEFLYSIFIGIAAILPGISGASFAMCFHYYERIINSLKEMGRHPILAFKSTWKIFLGIFVGGFICIILLNFMFQSFAYECILIFFGILLGEFPFLFKDANPKRWRYYDFIFFIICFLGLSYLQIHEVNAMSIEGFPNPIILFLLGMFSALSMIVPGLSGSLIYMSLGYYHILLQTGSNLAKSILFFNFKKTFFYVTALFPWAIGFLIGIIFFSKIFSLLFIKKRNTIYACILGCLCSTFFPIIKILASYNPTKLINFIGFILFFCSILISFVSNKKRKN